MTKGFRILRINQHLENPSKDVYVLEKSEKIHKEIDNYIKAKEVIKYRDNNKRSRS